MSKKKRKRKKRDAKRENSRPTRQTKLSGFYHAEARS